MKTIERYVFGAFLSSFVLAFLVLSFVLTIGLLVQIIGLVMDGVPMELVGQFCLVSLPETLQWSIPLALLVSSVLVFSRLSADSEVSAMRACGIHLWTVMKWPVAFGLLCTLLGFFVNNEIVPRGHEVRRKLKNRVSVDAGLSVLEPGHVITEFPNIKLYCGSRDGNWVHDLLALDYSNPKVSRIITAEKALVTQSGKDIGLDLYGMTVDPLDDDHPTMARFARFPYTIRNVLKDAKYTRRAKDFTFRDMFREVAQARMEVSRAAGEGRVKGTERNFALRDLSSLLVEFNKRFVFAMASICFVLIGMPLGIRAQRKESTVGMAISLAIALGYYLVITLMISLESSFYLHPECLIWLPVALCLGLAVKFVRRHL